MAGRRIYCVYCDHRYLPRAKVLIDSLRDHGCDDEVWLYCMTELCQTAALTLNFKNVRLIKLADLEAAYPGLPKVKLERTPLEFYYTCTPHVLDYAMKSSADIESVTYLDSDLWFFQNPQRVHEEIGDAPVAIIPHNFPQRLKKLEAFGKYNVGWVTFRRNSEGIACLEWWRDRCLEWCFGIPEGDRCGDQGYLNRFSEVARHTRVITHKGCNAAPWNVENYEVTRRDGDILLDDDLLVFFHFQGISKGLGGLYYDGHRRYGAPMHPLVRDFVYRPYVAVLDRGERLVQEALPQHNLAALQLRGRFVLGFDVKNLGRSLMTALYQSLDLMAGRPILVANSDVSLHSKANPLADRH